MNDFYTNISYRHSYDVWDRFEKLLIELIDHYNIKKICDIGGGANPSLTTDTIKSRGLDYTILDISPKELAKAPADYKKRLADIASPDFKIEDKFDLVFSKMLAEHITDAKQFHMNVLSCLNKNGLAVHFFPTLFTFPFFINYLVPEKLARALLNIFAPRDLHRQNKFPAYYRWCWGPTRKQIQKFTEIGYEINQYWGLFGHGYYSKIKIIQKLHDFKTSFLLRHPIPVFTNFAFIILRKR